MVSMKKSKEKLKEEKKPYDFPQDEYPYGLRICLDNESLKKLGVKNTFAVGTVLKLEAVVEVSSASMRETESGPEFSMDLQITEMELEKENTNSDRANKLYK